MAAKQTPEQYENQIKRMKLLAKSQTTFLKSSLQGKISNGAALVKKSIDALSTLGGSGNAVIEELKVGLTALKLHELDVDTAAAEVELREEIAILRNEIDRIETGSSPSPIPPPKSSSAPVPPPPGAAAIAPPPVAASMSAEDIARLKSLENENTSLRGLLKEAQTELSNSKGAILQAASGDASKYESQIAQLRAQLKQAETEAAAKLASVEQSMKAAASGKGGMEAEVARLNADLTKAQATLEKASKDAAEMLAKRTSELSTSNEQTVKKVTTELNALMAQKVAETEARLESEKEEMMEAVSQEIDEIEKAKVSELAALETKTGAELAALRAEKARVEEQLVKAKSGSQVISAGMVKLQIKIKLLAADYKKCCAASKAELNEFKSGIKSQIGGALVGKLNYLQEQLKVINGRYLKELAERKKLHNAMQELKGNIRVFMRCRPPSKKEITEFGSDAALCVSFPSPGEVKVLNEKSREKSWEFDEVFDVNSTQNQVYAEVSALVTSVMDGYNVCIFAYGQTGSGKTHTMQGPPEDRGVNLRALEELIQRADDRSEEYDDTISLSMLEVYNEEIHDLLVEGGSGEKLEVRQSERGNYVPNLVSVPVASMRNVMEALAVAEKNRSVTATNMNDYSSRSHMMLQITLTSVHKSSGNTSRGKLNLVDLAGSERINKSGATGQALKEAQNINQSLSALGDVIAARANKAAHIPFRNSKLTYLLQVRSCSP